MRTVCTAGTLVVALLIASSAAAAAKKKDGSSAGGVPYFQAIERYLKPVTLTDDQKAKLDDLKKEYEPKLKELYAKQDVLTPEQKKAGQEAQKAGKAAGKKGADLKAAVADAVKKTDDQKSQEQVVKKQLTSLENEMHKKIVALLTPEQKTQISAARGKKSDKAAPAAKAVDPAPAVK